MMKDLFCILLYLILTLFFSACSQEDSVDQASQMAVSLIQEARRSEYAETTESESTKEEMNVMILQIGEAKVDVQWEENETTEALKNLLQGGSLTIEMSMYGGFEQVGPVGTSLPRDDKQMTTAAGDIVLYSGNQIVVFYGSNSWAYTRLGHVKLSASEMSELLSHGDVTITLFVE